MRRTVVLAPEAEGDLHDIHAFIAREGGPDRAFAFIERIAGFVAGLADFPERGRRRDDLFPGLRVIGFARRVAIAFLVSETRVTVLRVLYAGRDLDLALRAHDA